MPTHFSVSTQDSLSEESAESTFVHDDKFLFEIQIHHSFRMETEEESEPPDEQDAQKQIVYANCGLVYLTLIITIIVIKNLF